MKSNPPIILKSAAALCLTAVLLASASCSSTPPPSSTGPVTTEAAFQNETGFAGQTIVNTTATTNMVVLLDPATRKIGLRRVDGHVTTYTAGPDVVNFNEIKIGDRVRATIVDEIAISMIPAGSPGEIGGSGVIARAQPGAKPGAARLDTTTFTATIVSTNPWRHQVTVQMADGQTKTITIRNDLINLADFNTGDEVRVRLTQALALLVEKP
jgi:hypothetical protein